MTRADSECEAFLKRRRVHSLQILAEDTMVCVKNIMMQVVHEVPARTAKVSVSGRVLFFCLKVVYLTFDTDNPW